ncbi:MAG: hypothetical protein V8Q30_07250 [Acutalibacteraceae bacterium]
MTRSRYDRSGPCKGLSVEAWVNPYRICNSSNGGQALSSDNPASDWLDSGSDVVIEYGGGIYDPAVRKPGNTL